MSAPVESEPPTAPQEEEKKPSCKICCACPDTRKVRDDCLVFNGEEGCGEQIEAHKACLRAEGFKVRRLEQLARSACNIPESLGHVARFNSSNSITFSVQV